jgi:hypothetical protein
MQIVMHIHTYTHETKYCFRIESAWQRSHIFCNVHFANVSFPFYVTGLSGLDQQLEKRGNTKKSPDYDEERKLCPAMSSFLSAI